MGVSTGGTSTNVPIVVLRGQRPSEVTITVDPAVPLYFAEVGLTPTQGTNLAMYDLANVQVLKGPQGTLFGRNSTGGALLLTPQTPGDEFGGYAEAKLGDYNLYHFEGAVDLPASDTLKFRLAGRSLDRDGYQSNVADNALRGDDKFWDENSYGLRLTASFTPTDGFSNLTTIAYDENEMLARVTTPQAFNSNAGLGQLLDVVHNGRLNGLFGTPVGKNIDAALARQRGRDWHEIETDVRAEEEIENWFAANTTEFELTDNLRIKNVFGYRDLDYSYPGGGDVDGTALPMIGARTSITEAVTLNPAIGSLEAEQFSDELQLLGTAFDDKLEWIVGAYWMQHGGLADDAAAEHRGEPRMARRTVTDCPVGPALAGGPNRLVPGFAGRRCRKRGLRAVRRGNLHAERAVVAHPRRPPELGRSLDDGEELCARHHDLAVSVCRCATKTACCFPTMRARARWTRLRPRDLAHGPQLLADGGHADLWQHRDGLPYGRLQRAWYEQLHAAALRRRKPSSTTSSVTRPTGSWARWPRCAPTWRSTCSSTTTSRRPCRGTTRIPGLSRRSPPMPPRPRSRAWISTC